MPKWEYLTINLRDLPITTQASDMLNEVGKEGWELVAITGNGVAYFKRPADAKNSAGTRDNGVGSLCG